MKHRLLPPHDNRREFNSHQRAAWITLFLWQGSRLSNKDIARLVNITTQGAGKMMAILSATLPIVFEDGKWQWMQEP